jgi:hypothetical protein
MENLEETVRSICSKLYPDADSLADKLIELARTHRGNREAIITNSRLKNSDAVLIAYGDHLKRQGESHLHTLGDWTGKYLKDHISLVHLLPFHPSTAYDGYSAALRYNALCILTHK